MSNFLHTLLTSPWGISLFILPFLFLLGDIITGALRAMKQGTFQLRMLADFGSHQLVSYVMIVAPALAVSFGTGQGLAGVVGLTQTSLLPWYAAQLASIDRNIAQLTGADEGIINNAITSLLNRFFHISLEDGNDENGAPPALPGTVAISA